MMRRRRKAIAPIKTDGQNWANNRSILPSSPTLHTPSLSVCGRTKKLTSMAYYQDVLEDDPTNGIAWIRLGNIYVSTTSCIATTTTTCNNMIICSSKTMIISNFCIRL